jgi:hypothetical protein
MGVRAAQAEGQMVGEDSNLQSLRPELGARPDEAIPRRAKIPASVCRATVLLR